MKITIERRGGVTGAFACGDRELAQLTAAQRRALERLMKAPPRPRLADHIHPLRYTLIVTEDDGQRRVLDVPEEAMPDELACIAEVKL